MGALLAAVALGWHVGCGPPRVDVEEDHSETCRSRCEKTFECDPEHPYSSVDECVTECNTPDDGIWRTEACDDLAEANFECIANLSCSDYELHHEDLDNSPCHEETWDISVCLAQNPESDSEPRPK